MRFSHSMWLLTLLLSSSMLMAQSVPSTVDNYFNQLRQNEYPPQPQDLWQKVEQHAEVLEALKPYYADSLAQLRAKAYYLSKQIGIHSQNSDIRQQVTQHLANGLTDEYSGNAGQAISYLSEFQSNDISPQAHQQIANLIPKHPAHFSSLLLLIGSLNMQDQISNLQAMVPTLTGRERWSANLALARLGDQEATTTIIARARRFPVNDDVVYELLPDLVYTRQKEAIDYLVTILYSEEKNCESANPEAEEPILCGYRVLELVTPVIRDFPLKADESGDLAVSDYRQALQQAREWLRQNPDFQLIKE